MENPFDKIKDYSRPLRVGEALRPGDFSKKDGSVWKKREFKKGGYKPCQLSRAFGIQWYRPLPKPTQARKGKGKGIKSVARSAEKVKYDLRNSLYGLPSSFRASVDLIDELIAIRVKERK